MIPLLLLLLSYVAFESLIPVNAQGLNTPPSITGILDQSTTVNSSVVVSFQIVDAQTSADSLLVAVTSSNPVLI
ncbi:MAG TPA: hypothetical protein VK633_08335, partial [Verrucomicrobiae bacterium]|nr:hypothetical protein [Verrucomicrobiae bacterium]